MRHLARARHVHPSHHWPKLAVGLVLAHGLTHTFLQSRPGTEAMAVFIAAPRVLFALTVLAIAAAAYDLVHAGWRRLLRGTAIFPVAALVASSLLALLTYRVYPSSHDNRPASWCLALPLDGDIVVLQGGRTLDTNSHTGVPSQRYAYDLGIVQSGSTHDGPGVVLSDYHAYGRLVSAPVAGAIVTVIDGEPDQSPSDDYRPSSGRAGGNQVVLQVDDGQYLFLAHLQPGSIVVRPGDRVEQGEPIGRVGNSGRSSAPHLHVHLQDHHEPNRGEAIPVDFCRYEVTDWGSLRDTAHVVERGMPTGRDRRQVIRPAPGPRR